MWPIYLLCILHDGCGNQPCHSTLHQKVSSFSCFLQNAIHHCKSSQHQPQFRPMPQPLTPQLHLMAVDIFFLPCYLKQHFLPLLLGILIVCYLSSTHAVHWGHLDVHQSCCYFICFLWPKCIDENFAVHHCLVYFNQSWLDDHQMKNQSLSLYFVDFPKIKKLLVIYSWQHR